MLAATADLTVTLTNINEVPSADAGPNQFPYPDERDCDAGRYGIRSGRSQQCELRLDADGRDGGTLTDNNNVRATFTVPAAVTEPTTVTEVTTYTFTFRVTDSTGLHSEDTVKVKFIGHTTSGLRPQEPMITSAASFTAARTRRWWRR